MRPEKDHNRLRIDRESLLRTLGYVSVGLGKQGFGNCFLFRKGIVCTYNEDIAAYAKVPIRWTGAVSARELLGVLEKWDCRFVTLLIEDGALFVYGGSRSKVRLVLEDAQDAAEFDLAFGTDWQPVPAGFLDAIAAVEDAAATGTDIDEGFTRCVHITPKAIEATDLTQYARCRIRTPVQGSVCILRDSAKVIAHLGANEMCETSALLCFRNDAGVQVGIRKQEEEFPEGEGLIADIREYPEYALPGDFLGALSTSEIFAKGEERKYVGVRLTQGQMTMTAMNPLLGEIEEERPMAGYDGPDLEFVCEVRLLRRLAEYGRMRVAPNGDLYRLVVADKGFVFMISTMEPEMAEPEYGDDESMDEDED